MKFTCGKDELIKEISIAQEIISSRNVLSILSNVLLIVESEALTIRATDLKVGFETQIPVEMNIQGRTTVFCDKLLGVLRSLPEGDIEFELKENMMLNIRPVFKKIDFQLKCISSEKYPEMVGVEDREFFEFSQKDLIQMIANTVFSVSDDETRYFMNGVYLEKTDENLIMVASDGKRLSYISKKMEQNIGEINGIIIPPKLLNMLRKLLPGEGVLSLCFTDKNVFARYGNHLLSSNIIDGQFPDYRRVIPESQEYEVIVQKDMLESAIRRVALLVEQKSRRIFLTLAEDNLTISSEESEIGQAKEEVACQYKGPEETIALNCRFLSEPLKEMEEDVVRIAFTEANKAVTMTSSPEKEYVHVVMPMQTK